MAKRKPKTPKTEAFWRKGFRKSARVDPRVASDELKRLREIHNGTVSASQLIDAAKAKNNPLHGMFEWDDSEAAREWRLHEARGVINAIVVVQVDNPNKGQLREYEIEPRQYKRGEERTYKPLEEMMANPEERVLILQRALNELVAFQRKYRALTELAGIFRAIEDALIEQEA